MIINLKNPHSLELPQIRALFARAFENHLQADGETVLAELSRHIDNEALTVLIARDDEGQYRGLSVIMFPATRLFSTAQVYHFYFNGPAKLRKTLIRATVLACEANGYNRFVTTNLNGKERAFQRLFSEAGEIVELGDHKLYEIRTNREDQHVRSR